MKRAALVVALVFGACGRLPPVVLPPLSASEGQQRFAVVESSKETARDADARYELLVGDVVQKIRASDGNVAVYVLRRASPDSVEFVIVSFWQSRDDASRCCAANVCRCAQPPFELSYETMRSRY